MGSLVLSFTVIVTLLTTGYVDSECHNACSNNGLCKIYDTCECFKNWMGNDCSLRICQFGRAHVDVPLFEPGTGGGGGIGRRRDNTTGINDIFYNQLYPYGANSRFPIITGAMRNISVISNESNTISTNILTNTAHVYAECSNKGTCDRVQGECNCMNGFEGSACQRNVCPTISDVACNGHGACVTARKMARLDSNNIYQLWDAGISMGCKCDPGYYGAVCEQRTCKLGYDPVYFDLDINSRVFETSRRYSNWTFIIAATPSSSSSSLIYPPTITTTTATTTTTTTTTNTTITTIERIVGKYVVKFYDYNHQLWYSSPIQYNASCAEITNALESLPNRVIPKNSIRCLKFDHFISPTKSSSSSTSTVDDIAKRDADLGFILSEKVFVGIKYTIAFPYNPGKLQQIEIKTKLNNSRRPSLLVVPISTLVFNSTSNTSSFVSLTENENMDIHADGEIINDIPIYGNNSLIHTFVYPNGYSGEKIEYFTNKCHLVDVTVLNSGLGYHYLSDLTNYEFRLLAQCLGKANDNPSQYSAQGRVTGTTFNWDYGSIQNPHVVRLVEKSEFPKTDLCIGSLNSVRGIGITTPPVPLTDGSSSSSSSSSGTSRVSDENMKLCSSAFTYSPGFIVPLYYDEILEQFILLTRPADDYSALTHFTVFTTTATAQIVNENVKVYTDPHTPYSTTIYTKNTTNTYLNFIGNTDCESTSVNIQGAYDCTEKNKMIFILDPFNYLNNPTYMNIYTVTKSMRITQYHPVSNYNTQNKYNSKQRPKIQLDMSINAAWDEHDINIQPRLYVFKPVLTNQHGFYEYVSECANRGLCDIDNGLCKCYTGYTGDDCSNIDNSLTLPYTDNVLDLVTE